MRCKNCGWDNPDQNHECEKCGAPLMGAAEAPAVGNPTPGGLFTSEVENVIQSLSYKNVVGMDVVETATDKLGENTAVCAAKIICDFLSLINKK